ncbi:MAG: competence protein CoiA family protein [Candidatus Thorarchaeota archaeon]
MSDLFSTHSSNSESFYHKAIKRLFFKFISENSKNVREKSLEKNINNRRADVYFRLNSGKQIVIEVQSSKISVKELIQRTKDYNKSGIYVLWILYGNGACIASPKFPQDKKNLKISHLENFLHWMYGGRVYYVNFNFYEDKITISIPFALHFSLSSKKKNQTIFWTKFESYYIKNVNFAKIPSWNLLCVNYNGYKLARFYDKSIKRVLKNKIIKNYKLNLKKSKNQKKFIKLIINHFKQKYGLPLLLQVLLELIKNKKIDLNKKYIFKLQKKYIKINYI